MQIVNLNLFSAEITALQKFYTNVLGFELNDINRSYFSVKIGNSVLKFTKRQFDIISNYIFVLKINKEKFANFKSNENLEILDLKIEEILEDHLVIKDFQSNLIIIFESEIESIQSVLFISDNIENIKQKLTTSFSNFIGINFENLNKNLILSNKENSLISNNNIEISPFSINLTIENSPKTIIFNGKDIVITNF